MILHDLRNIFKATIDKTTGFLTAPVVLARTGVQYYMGAELGLNDRASEQIGVFRSSDEVFHPDSIKSFINLVVTDDHPTELVTVDNVKKLQVGMVSDVNPDNNVLSGIATVTDKTQVLKAKDGKIEVSVGYSNELKEEKGVHDGIPYEFIQTNIRANHLAIVDAGRCGTACKITLDKENKSMKVIIDGMTFEVADDLLGQAIQKQQAAFDAEFKKFEKKEKEDEEEKKELKKKKEAAEATGDALKKDILDADAINALVSARASLLTDAKAILGDKMPECIDCPTEIKTAVIDHVLDMGDLSGKSDDYIDAAYDVALKKAEKTTDSLDNLADDLLDEKGNKKPVASRKSARASYMKDTGFSVPA